MKKIASDMGKKLKISSTAYRVLLLLLKLNEKNMSIDELNFVFSEEPEVARYFSKDVIVKYINTLRTAGYIIERPTASSNYRYVLKKAPVKINFSDEEITTLALLKNYSISLQQDKYIKNFNSFIEKLVRYMPQEQVTNLNEQLEVKIYDEIINKFREYSDLIKKIEQYIIENQRVELKYKPDRGREEAFALARLQKIKYEANNVKISYYDLVAGQNNSVNIADITHIRQLPSISGEGQALCPVIFKLRNKLAKVYRPYENEKISEISLKAGEITVTSYSEDIDFLLQRLLKYGENCELIYPKPIRNKMIKLIDSTLENYGLGNRNR